jgi:hypothetical protein
VSERNYWEKHVKGAIRSLPNCYAYRVEIRDTMAGVPDVDYVVDGNAGKIELKSENADGYIAIRESQWRFFRSWSRAGGHVIMLIRFKEGNLSKHYLLTAEDVHRLGPGRHAKMVVAENSSDSWVGELPSQELREWMIKD